MVGVDFAGPLKYRKGKNNEAKAYIVLYACSLTRGIYLELLPNMETKEFMSSLKRFIGNGFMITVTNIETLSDH